ncbi:MAG: hypothetical protein ABJD97_02755 [Betaproteobacteria bacterium]
MPDPQPQPALPAALIAIKVAHTLVWAFFVACIVAIPWAAWRGHLAAAGWLAAVVALEVAVLAFNGGRCPMTSAAARFSDETRPNFDIYLPAWLARYNKAIFGVLDAAGVVYALACWAEHP